jgi:hypothetical protein
MVTVTLKSGMVVELLGERTRIKECPPRDFILVTQPAGGFTLLEEGKTYEGEGVIEEGSLFLDQGWRRVLLGRVAD